MFTYDWENFLLTNSILDNFSLLSDTLCTVCQTYILQILPLPVVSVLNTKVLLSTCELWYMTPVCILSCPTLHDPMDYIPPGCTVHGTLQARILECVDISYSRGSSQPRDWTLVSCISCIGRWIPYHCSTSTFQKHQFFGSQFSLYSYYSHIHTWLLEKP